MKCLFDLTRPSTIAPTSTSPTGASRAVVYPLYFWPLGYTIRIAFVNNVQSEEYNQIKLSSPVYTDPKKNDLIDPIQFTHYGKVDGQTLIKQVIRERIAPHVGLQFIFSEDYSNADIRIRFNIDPTSATFGVSLCGTEALLYTLSDQYKETMIFYNLEVMVILHEFMHALGFQHEQLHKDVQINPVALECWLKHENITQTANVISQFISNQPLLSSEKIDPSSIMTYTLPKTILCNDTEYKFYTVQNTNGNIQFTENYKLSAKDIESLEQIYPKDENEPRKFDNKLLPVELEDEANIWVRKVLISNWFTQSIESFFREPHQYVGEILIWSVLYIFINTLIVHYFHAAAIIALIILELVCAALYFFYMPILEYKKYIKYFINITFFHVNMLVFTYVSTCSVTIVQSLPPLKMSEPARPFFPTPQSKHGIQTIAGGNKMNILRKPKDPHLGTKILRFDDPAKIARGR